LKSGILEELKEKNYIYIFLKKVSFKWLSPSFQRDPVILFKTSNINVLKYA